jgi:flavin reductase (DIM6/NTAB) family NADH-FMN oxidoreductase RutF
MMVKKDVPEQNWGRVWALNPLVIVTTSDSEGFVNAAPYGMCMRVCHKPLMIALSVNQKWDTYKNIKQTGEFVVNVPSDNVNMLQKIMITGKHFPPRVNELDKAGLTSLPSRKIKPPRIKECKAHFECKIDWMKEVGGYSLVVGNVVAVNKLRPVHYLGKFYKTIFVGVGEIHDVEKLQCAKMLKHTIQDTHNTPLQDLL